MLFATLIWKKYKSARIFFLTVGLIGFLFLNTTGFSQEYRQIIVATGSPYELGLVDELAKAFRVEHGGANAAR